MNEAYVQGFSTKLAEEGLSADILPLILESIAKGEGSTAFASRTQPKQETHLALPLGLLGALLGGGMGLIPSIKESPWTGRFKGLDPQKAVLGGLAGAGGGGLAGWGWGKMIDKGPWIQRALAHNDVRQDAIDRIASAMGVPPQGDAPGFSDPKVYKEIQRLAKQYLSDNRQAK